MTMQPQTYSINGLSVELGLDRRTLAKRLASVPPAAMRGKSKRWRLRDVLRALDAHNESLDAPVGESSRRAQSPADFLAGLEMGLRPLEAGVNTFGWTDMLKMFGVDGDELREWLRYGAPFLTRGDLRTGEGWEFSIPHVARWLALFGAALQRLDVVADLTRPGEATRRLRGAS